MASIVGELFRSDCFDPLATWWHIFHPTKVGYPTFIGYPTIEVGLPPDNGHCRLKMNDTPGNKGRLLKSNDNVRNHSDLNDVVVFHESPVNNKRKRVLSFRLKRRPCIP